MSIGISSGTATFEIALCLTDLPELRVVANSLPVATFLHSNGRDDLTLIVTGGIPQSSNRELSVDRSGTEPGRAASKWHGAAISAERPRRTTS